MQRNTVACETTNPSFSSSPWIRGAPHKKFSWLIRTISARTSPLILGRPPRQRRHEPDPQIAQKPRRRQRKTVPGWAMIRPRCQFAHQRDKNTQNSLTRAETWPPCACSLQDRKLMAQDDEFQQQIKALAAPRPHCRKPSKDPSRHEL